MKNKKQANYVILDDGGPHSLSYKRQSALALMLEAHDRVKNKPTMKSAAFDTRNGVDALRFKQAERSTKLATVVGGPNHSELEKAFSQIAETYITDKAPLLTNYMLGFQLLKKTEDDTKACGIFAYKVGDELVYIPVFSIDGDVQGHELMYVVSRDQFVPSDEKWVNYLLSRKPLEPGRVERRDRSDIPSRGTMRPTYMSSGLKLSSFDGKKEIPPLLGRYDEVLADAIVKQIDGAIFTIGLSMNSEEINVLGIFDKTWVLTKIGSGGIRFLRQRTGRVAMHDQHQSRTSPILGELVSNWTRFCNVMFPTNRCLSL